MFRRAETRLKFGRSESVRPDRFHLQRVSHVEPHLHQSRQQFFLEIEQKGRVIYDSRSDIPLKEVSVSDPAAELIAAWADDAFARFYAVYPRQVEEAEAHKEWAKAVAGGADIEMMIARARVYAMERAAAIAGGDDPQIGRRIRRRG